MTGPLNPPAAWLPLGLLPGIVMEWHGLALWSCVCVVDSSALAVEAWELRFARTTAMEWNFPQVLFESDNKELINCMANPLVRCSGNCCYCGRYKELGSVTAGDLRVL